MLVLTMETIPIPTARTRAPTKAGLDAARRFPKTTRHHQAQLPPTPTYDYDAPFCRASPLRRLSTYKARPIRTIPTNRRESIPYLTNGAG